MPGLLTEKWKCKQTVWVTERRELSMIKLSLWLKARLHGSPRVINAVESTKVNRVNSSFQRGWRVNKLAMANFRSPSLIHFGWLTTDYPFVSCFSMYGFTFDNNSKNCSRDILKWFLYIFRSSLVHSTNNVFDAPNMLRLIIHGLTHQRRFFPFISFFQNALTFFY